MPNHTRWIAACVVIACARCAAAQQAQPLTPAQAMEYLKSAPPGAEVVIEQSQQQADGTGPGFSGDGNAIKGGFNTEAPAVGLNGTGAAKGAGAVSTFEIKGAESQAVRILVAALGGLCLIGGVGGGVYLQNRRLIGGGLAAGIPLLVAALAPSLFLWCIVAAVLCLIGFLVYAEWQAKRKDEGLKAAAQSVMGLSAEARASFWKLLEAHTDNDAEYAHVEKAAKAVQPSPATV